MNVIKRYFTNMPKSAFIAALCVFLLSQPFFVWELFRNNYIKVSVLLICCGLFALHCKFDRRNNVNMFLYWMVTLMLLWYTSGQNFIVIIPYISLLFIPFANNYFSSKVFKAFYDIISIFLLFSLFFYILYILGFPLPSSTIGALNQLKSYNYISYPFFVVPNQLGVDVTRFCSFWDEPGCVGTYTILLLGANRFNMKGWKSIIILVSGILSMSFFFYGVLFALSIYKMIRRGIKTFYRVVFIVMIVILIYMTLTEGTVLYEYVGWRFEYDAVQGKFVGDNRIGDFAMDYLADIAWKDDSFFWGVKDRVVFDMIEGTSSYIGSIFRYGFVAFVIYVLFFIICGFRNFKSKTDFVVFLIVLTACTYQRPGVADIMYVFIYTMWIKFYDNPVLHAPSTRLKNVSVIYNNKKYVRK